MLSLHCKLNIVLVGLALAACGGSGETTTANATTTAGPTTGSGEPTTGGTTAGTSTGGGASSSGGATSTATETTTTGVGESTAGETGNSGDTGSSSGGAEMVPCMVDSDCTLVEDCCSCEPIGPGEQPPECDQPECPGTACGFAGLNGAEVQCRFGRCTFVKIDCNPTGVTCDGLPPDCQGTEVASVDVDLSCWTGQCVPAEACDWVPDCAYCDDAESICVNKLQKGPYTVCEPKPVGCGDVDDIDCGCGAEVCAASPPHTECHDVSDDIACECPFC